MTFLKNWKIKNGRQLHCKQTLFCKQTIVKRNEETDADTQNFTNSMNYILPSVFLGNPLYAVCKDRRWYGVSEKEQDYLGSFQPMFKYNMLEDYTKLLTFTY